MENRDSSSSMASSSLFIISILLAISGSSLAQGNGPTTLFDANFIKGCPDTNFETSTDGQTWALSLTKAAGCGFQTNNNYRFGWFSMKIKLAGGNSAGIVTAYYMCSDIKLGPTRDEVDIEFLGNVTGQPYIIQTNVYKNGTGNREMRHYLWFDPTEDFHEYSILWNSHQLVWFVDTVPIRVYKNTNYTNNFYPISQPMYLFSSIWNADDWATMGGAVKTNWTLAPFVSSYKDFVADACEWENPFPACVSTTVDHWWDQYPAWHLSESQKTDYAWVLRNLVVYNYCTDTKRFNGTMPVECAVSPWS